MTDHRQFSSSFLDELSGISTEHRSQLDRNDFHKEQEENKRKANIQTKLNTGINFIYSPSREFDEVKSLEEGCIDGATVPGFYEIITNGNPLISEHSMVYPIVNIDSTVIEMIKSTKGLKEMPFNGSDICVFCGEDNGRVYKTDAVYVDMFKRIPILLYTMNCRDSHKHDFLLIDPAKNRINEPKSYFQG